MIPSRFPRIAAWLFHLAITFASTSAAAEPKRRFDLPAGDAAVTLAGFAEQANREIMFVPDAVRGVSTNAVAGEYQPHEALNLLVARTGLVVTRDAASGALAVRKGAPDSNGSKPGTTNAASTTGRSAPLFGEGTIVGTVTNSATGMRLEGARVTLKGTQREVATDSSGAYRISSVPSGNAVLMVSYTGLKPVELAVTVVDGITTQNAGMTSDLYIMSSFVVESEREGNAKAITLQRQSDGVKNVVSADAFGGLAGNPADLALRLPGVEGESLGGDMRYLRIRGLHQNLSSITQDGNRLADAASAGATREFQFTTVSADTIERMEVIKSPTPDMDADSIGGAVNLVTKSAFDGPQERRIRASVGAIWRVQDPRDKPRPNSSLSYSEVFRGKLGVSLNLGYRPHGSIFDLSAQTHELLPSGVTGPAYQYNLQIQDVVTVRTRSGAGLRFDYKLSDEVRLFANFQLHKHVEHSDRRQVQWQTNQVVATRDASGNLGGTGGIVPGYTDYETAVRPINASLVAIASLVEYKLGATKTANVGAVHRYPSIDLDYDVYSSLSKSDYPGNNTFTYTLRSVGFTIRKDDRFSPSVTQTAGPDWRNLANYTQNAYSSTRRTGWDKYQGAAINFKKRFDTKWPSYVKTGLRFREQTRDLKNSPYRTEYVGPDGVMGPNSARGGANDDNLAQFGLEDPLLPDTSLRRYGSFPFPAKQADGRTYSLDPLIAANPSHWRPQLANDLRDDLLGHQQFVEQVRAAYLMGNVEVGKLSILGGARIEETETEGEGSLQIVTPAERARRGAWVGALTDAEIRRRAVEEFGRRVKRSGDNRGVFPGLHLKYRFNRNVLARLSYSENIGRPNIGQLIPQTNADFDNQTLLTSNPGLEPQQSQNFDLSTEFYFEPAGLFTVGVFQKDLKKFIYTASGGIVPSGQDNDFGGEYAGYAMTTQYNGGSAKIRGIELSYLQQWTFLPGIWKGLGGFANVTMMEANGNYGNGDATSLAPNPKMAGFNPFIANIGLSYIQGQWNLRANLNFRGKYLNIYNANESRAGYIARRQTLDLKTIYNVNRRFSVYLDVVNVLNEPERQLQFGHGRPNNSQIMVSPQFFFGVNYRQ